MKSLSRFFYLGSTIIFCSLFTAPIALSMENNKKQAKRIYLQQPDYLELVKSITNNDCETLKRLIAENNDLTSATYAYDKNTQISITCLGLVMGFNEIAPIPMMQILLDSGADVNQGQETDLLSKDPVPALLFATRLPDRKCYNFLSQKIISNQE